MARMTASVAGSAAMALKPFTGAAESLRAVTPRDGRLCSERRREMSVASR